MKSGLKLTSHAPSFSNDKAKSDVIILSDSESDSDTSSTTSVEVLEHKHIVIDLEESPSSPESVNDSVISLNDSVIIVNDSTDLSATQDLFKIDTTPNFIPVDRTPDFIPIKSRCKRKCGKHKKAKLNSPEVPNTIEVSNTAELLNDIEVPNTTNRKSRGFFETHRVNYKTPVIQLSYPNILNDAAETQRIGLRPIIIDGCNVGFGYGNGNFMMRGIILVIQYFKNRGHEDIVCFLPNRFRHRIRSPSEGRVVTTLEKENFFSFTPSRHLENGKRYTPYDDRYIVQYATERQGVIISNDGYRDLINEESSWRETIEKRIINYTFARGMFMLPKDPLGPTGPTLDEMLRFQ